MKSSPRFVFLDALRGFAALGVLLCHSTFATKMGDVFFGVFPEPLRLTLWHGALGVNIFFVLSGFVIAHSLRDNPLDFSSLLRFIGRRHIRLDLPYWTILTLMVALSPLKRFLPGTHSALPTPGALAANLSYSHFIFAQPGIVGVAWTLCLEVQFYLLFVVLLVVGRKLFPRALCASVPTATSGAIVLVAVLSLVCLAATHRGPQTTYFWGAWHFFGSGVLLYWMWKEAIAPRWLWAMMGAWILNIAWTALVPVRPFYFQIASLSALFVTISTLGVIFFVARRGALEKWSGGRAFSFLGRISYSLYLTHLPVVELSMNAAFRLTGFNPVMACLWYLVVVALAISVATLFHLCIEAPAMRLASRLSRTSSSSPREIAPIEIAR